MSGNLVFHTPSPVLCLLDSPLKDESYICITQVKVKCLKKLRPAVDLMAFKCRTLKVKRILLYWLT
jgi:hypothetical protein